MEGYSYDGSPFATRDNGRVPGTGDSKGDAMKVVIKGSVNKYDGTPTERLIIDGKQRARVSSLCECPEDAIIGRDLISCNEIAEFMEEAWIAGKKGEDFVITKEPDDEE
jgi:hypothetical protein